MIFEIHITGDPSINANSSKLGLSNITLSLLKPDLTYFRTEHMTSHVLSFESYDQCKSFVDEIVLNLNKLGSKISRVKIETPYYADLVDQSFYIESHFEGGDFPASQKVGKTKILRTDREYDKAKYKEFLDKYSGKEIELCVYDDNVKEDEDWFLLFSDQKIV